LLVLAGEICNQITHDGAEFAPMATLVHDTRCGTLSGLSKVYRACGYRVGWGVFSGARDSGCEYLAAFELLAS
jgi:alanine-synthesizing transaminase